MKKLISTSVAVAALLATPAIAADMSVRAPAIVAPSAPSWTGAYVGLGLGGRWGTTTWTTTVADFTGPVPLDTSSPREYGNSSFHISGYVGYNFQFGNWLTGLEADLGWANSENTIVGFPGLAINNAPPGDDLTSVKLKWDGSVRGRLGFLVTPSVLLYATGGWAFQNINSAASCTTNTGWCNGVNVQSTSFDQTLNGWTLGGGAEMMLAGNWLVRAEYRYSDFGTHTNTYLIVPADAFTAGLKTKTNIARFGVAYKFGGP
jgi:outer membrane immunogenic protein